MLISQANPTYSQRSFVIVIERPACLIQRCRCLKKRLAALDLVVDFALVAAHSRLDAVEFQTRWRSASIR